MQPLYIFGGEQHTQVINLSLANGFPPQTYLPLLQGFTDRYRVVCLQPRALWPGEAPPDATVSWDQSLTTDLLDGLRDHQLDQVIGMGHSMGGVANILAALRQPERFKALVLLDPTILPREALQALTNAPVNPFAERAENRLNNFDDADHAFNYFKGRGIFKDWPDSALRLYAETLRPDGMLAWQPMWEAYYFRSIYPHTWECLPDLHTVSQQHNLPILLLRGADTDVLTEESTAEVRKIVPGITYAEIPGGHLFPQTNAEATARAIRSWLDEKRL